MHGLAINVISLCFAFYNYKNVTVRVKHGGKKTKCWRRSKHFYVYRAIYNDHDQFKTLLILILSLHSYQSRKLRKLPCLISTLKPPLNNMNKLIISLPATSFQYVYQDVFDDYK